jgi:toxin YoeB
MRKVEFHGDAMDELTEWFEEDRKAGLRVMRLIKECRQTPYEGIGKPEPLKGDKRGMWSRRIDEKHRIVYAATDENVIIYQLRGHYDD